MTSEPDALRPSVAATPPKVRLRQRLLLGAAIALILGATLTPLHGVVEYLPPWCILCSELATLDLVQNIFLFAPLGLAFAALGVVERRALAWGLALTLAVESLQFVAIPGRDASVGDVLMNFIGTWLGFRVGLSWRRLVLPGRVAARRLAGAWSALWVLVMAITGIAMQPSVPDHVFWTQWTPVRGGTVPFPGRLLSVRLGGTPIGPGEAVESSEIREALRSPGSRFEVDVVPGEPTRRRALIARVANPIGVAVSTAQLRRSFECQRRLAAASLHLRVPSIVLVDAFPAAPAGPEGELHRFGCDWDRGHLVAARLAPGSMVRRAALSLGEGWLLLTPVPIPLGTLSLAGSAVWLALLAFPAGYWLVRARATSQSASAGVIIAAAMWCALTAVCFIVIPLTVGVPVPAAGQWLASVAGGLAGASFAVAAPAGVTA